MTKKLWGGRFKKEIDQDFFAFQKSISYDYKLAEYDLVHSMIHVQVLKNAKILTFSEGNKLGLALRGLLQEVKSGKFKANSDSEDIHTEIQNRIEKKVGKLGLKLHTLRSRNDQIAFDEKFYCRDSAVSIAILMIEVLAALKDLAIKYQDVDIVGYTHTQRAQDVNFKDYMGAFFVMFSRDAQRLIGFSEELKICIGSGAIKGTSLTSEYDKAIKEVAKFLDKKRSAGIFTVENPLEHVSDRDFIIEFLNSLSILQMHLSRLAEDFILYSTQEFNFLNLPEEFCTGSSLMPHKKNPDFLELVRGSTGKIYGNLVSLLTLMKGLPLTYNRDMQLDKEPLFSSVETIKEELKILARFIRGVQLNKEVIKTALEDESLYAVSLTERLVRKGVSFSEAHVIVGKLIRYSEENYCKIKDMHAGLLNKFSPYLNKKMVEEVFDARV